MTDVSVPLRLRSGVYAELELSVEHDSALTDEDLLATLRSQAESIEADLNRREEMKSREQRNES